MYIHVNLVHLYVVQYCYMYEALQSVYNQFEHMMVICLPSNLLAVRGGLEDVLHVVGQDQAEEVSASLLQLLMKLRGVVEFHKGILEINKPNFVLKLG